MLMIKTKSNELDPSLYSELDKEESLRTKQRVDN